MDENSGQQFALQVAVQTMKERCLQLQQRLSIVEEENMNLRVKNHIDALELSHHGNKSELEILHEKIAQLTKQKSQLTHNVLMVATENRHLWNRLSKLTQTNQTVGDNVTKISEHLGNGSPQPQSPTTSTQTTLIRSKTFTHETQPKIVKKTEENTYTDTSLEDISLKIINSIAQEKFELEKQCAQMAEMQSTSTKYESVLTNSIGFAYPYDELEDNVVEEMTQNMENLIHIKNSLIEQQGKLKVGYDLLKRLIAEGGVPCKKCKEENKRVQEPQPLRNLTFNRADVDKKHTNVHHKSTNNDESEKICPICNKLFINEHISELVKHVECHFIAEENDFDMIGD